MIAAVWAGLRKRGSRKKEEQQKALPANSPRFKGSKSFADLEQCNAKQVGKLPRQAQVKDFYDSIGVQVGVASVILLNFLVSICEYQMLPPEESEATNVFKRFEFSFNTIFLVELVINLYANFFFEFWIGANAPWNIFDFVIVFIAWLAMYMDNIPGITVLRLFRAFRVFKLFKKIEAIRVIMVGITRSLPGVSNACVLLGLVMGIWSIMGVQFFRTDFPDEFGRFSRAMLTMCQMATFDSWVSGVARPVILHKNASLASAPFFISYAFMSAIIMMNVVVAILLDKFIMASKEVKEDLAALKQAKAEEKAQIRTLQAVVVLQSVVREYRVPTAAKRLLRRSRNGAVTIQKMVRGWLCRKKFKVMLKMYRVEHGYESPPKGRGKDDDLIEKGRVEAMIEVQRRIKALEARFASWQLETMDLVQQILARTKSSGKRAVINMRPLDDLDSRPTIVEERPNPRSDSGWLCSGNCKNTKFSRPTDAIEDITGSEKLETPVPTISL